MRMPHKKFSTIRIDVETRKKLARLGHKDETYDDVINRLIDHYLKTHKLE